MQARVCHSAQPWGCPRRGPRHALWAGLVAESTAEAVTAQASDAEGVGMDGRAAPDHPEMKPKLREHININRRSQAHE